MSKQANFAALTKSHGERSLQTANWTETGEVDRQRIARRVPAYRDGIRGPFLDTQRSHGPSVRFGKTLLCVASFATYAISIRGRARGGSHP
jgi:hypothetical protein